MFLVRFSTGKRKQSFRIFLLLSGFYTFSSSYTHQVDSFIKVKQYISIDKTVEPHLQSCKNNICHSRDNGMNRIRDYG